MQQIQLPQGMKDTILQECEKKEYLQNTLEQIFESFGYEEIITPTIEYYETYENAFKNIQTTDMYKFFDENGRILTLRTDMTVPIARVCASKFKDSKPPFRYRYTSNVFKVRQKFAGKRSEVTDCGIELIGLDSKSDVQVLSPGLYTEIRSYAVFRFAFNFFCSVTFAFGRSSSCKRPVFFT